MVDDIAYRKCSPTKNSPGAAGTTPPSWIGSPSPPSTAGRSIQSNPVSKPVHHTMFAASMARPSSVTGRPSRTPAMRGSRSTPAAASSPDLTRMSGVPCAIILGRALRPIGVLMVNTRWKTTRSRKGARKVRPAKPPMRNGTSPVGRPDIQTCRLRASSIAISAPELPAPAISTLPARSCAGFRYSDERSCTMSGRTSPANAGRRCF
jgi:hypothetical protein